MSDISRRSFLKSSAGAISSSALASASALKSPIFAKPRENVQNNKNAKIYTVFHGLGLSHDDSSLTPTTNEQIVRQLQSACEGVDFVVRDLGKSDKVESVLNEIRDLKRLNYDGVIVLGDTNIYKLVLTGLPTIVAHNVVGFLHIPYKLYLEKGKILFSSLDRLSSCSPSITKAMFEDLVGKIKLIRALKKMKESKLLLVNRGKYISAYFRGERRTTYPPGFNELILDTLEKTFGTKVQKIEPDEIYEDEDIQNIWYNDDKEQKEIAKMWINEAKGMRGTMESEVVKSAKMYQALKLLLEKYKGDAIAYHLRRLINSSRREDRAWPSLGDSELQKQGIVALCQSHLNVSLTHMLAQYAFDLPSMLGDFTIDPFNNTVIVQHCGGPHNFRGENDRTPYVIRDHAERGFREHAVPGCGAASEVIFPENEPVTIWRLSLLTKEILVHTGKTVSGYKLYKEFTDLM